MLRDCNSRSFWWLSQKLTCKKTSLVVRFHDSARHKSYKVHATVASGINVEKASFLHVRTFLGFFKLDMFQASIRSCPTRLWINPQNPQKNVDRWIWFSTEIRPTLNVRYDIWTKLAEILIKFCVKIKPVVGIPLNGETWTTLYRCSYR